MDLKPRLVIVNHFRDSIMAAQARVLKNGILLGQVIPSTLTQAIKVQVPYFVFDDVLKAYFKKAQDFIAHDVQNLCKTGDLVIIKKLEKPEKKEITHTVTERIFRLGDVQDPISGEMVVGTQYRFVSTQNYPSVNGGQCYFAAGAICWRKPNYTVQISAILTTREHRTEEGWREPETSLTNQHTGSGTNLKKMIRMVSATNVL